MDEYDGVKKLKRSGRAVRKDKGKPSKSGYIMFSRSKRPAIVKQFPNLSFGAISKKIGAMWSQLSVSQKNVFNKQALEYAKKAPKRKASLKKGSIIIGRGALYKP